MNDFFYTVSMCTFFHYIICTHIPSLFIYTFIWSKEWRRKYDKLMSKNISSKDENCRAVLASLGWSGLSAQDIGEQMTIYSAELFCNIPLSEFAIRQKIEKADKRTSIGFDFFFLICDHFYFLNSFESIFFFFSNTHLT